MKHKENHSLLVLLLISSFFSLLKAQYPTAPGTIWEYGSYNYFLNPPPNDPAHPFWFPPPRVFTDSIAGDTGINGRVYQEIHRYGNLNGTFFTRVSGDTLFLLDSVAGPTNLESILFNFGLQNNSDTILSPYYAYPELHLSTPLDLSMGQDYLASPVLNQYYGNTHIEVWNNGGGMRTEWVKDIGMSAYEFMCLAEGCPDPNFYLRFVRQGTLLLYTMPQILMDLTEENSMADFMEVFPNPSSGLLNIEFQLFKPSEVKLEAFDSQGKLVSWKSEDNSNGFMQLDLTGHAPGVYFLKLSREGTTGWKRLVLE